MTKVLVTGGAGFIASHLVDSLVELGYKVVVIDNLSTGLRENLNPKAKFYKVDIRDYKKITEIFNKEKPDIVNHHAAQIDVRKSTSDPMYDAECNIVGSLNLILNSRQQKVKRFIYISSGGAIYGNVPKKDIPIKEDYPAHPISPYGASKYAVEHYLYLENYLYNLSYITLRYSNVYGPRQNPKGEAGVNAIFIGNMFRNKKCTIFGDGSKTRDYVYVKDVVRANILAMESDFVGAVNIGTSAQISDQEVFDTIKSVIGYKGEPVYADFRPGEVMHIALDITRARRVLNWKPEYTYERGIRETVKFFKDEM